MEYHREQPSPDFRERPGKDSGKLSKSERPSWRIFQERAEGWMISSDGDTYCSRHWEQICAKVAQPGFEEEARAVGIKGIHDRFWNARDGGGWYVDCAGREEDGTFCRENLFVPFDVESDQPSSAQEG